MTGHRHFSNDVKESCATASAAKRYLKLHRAMQSLMGVSDMSSAAFMQHRKVAHNLPSENAAPQGFP